MKFNWNWKLVECRELVFSYWSSVFWLKFKDNDRVSNFGFFKCNLIFEWDFVRKNSKRESNWMNNSNWMQFPSTPASFSNIKSIIWHPTLSYLTKNYRLYTVNTHYNTFTSTTQSRRSQKCWVFSRINFPNVDFWRINESGERRKNYFSITKSISR